MIPSRHVLALCFSVLADTDFLQAFLAQRRNLVNGTDMRVVIDAEVLQAYLFSVPAASWTGLLGVQSTFTYHIYNTTTGPEVQYGFGIGGEFQGST